MVVIRSNLKIAVVVRSNSGRSARQVLLRLVILARLEKRNVVVVAVTTVRPIKLVTATVTVILYPAVEQCRRCELLRKRRASEERKQTIRGTTAVFNMFVVRKIVLEAGKSGTITFPFSRVRPGREKTNLITQVVVINNSNLLTIPLSGPRL